MKIKNATLAEGFAPNGECLPVLFKNATHIDLKHLSGGTQWTMRGTLFKCDGCGENVPQAFSFRGNVEAATGGGFIGNNLMVVGEDEDFHPDHLNGSAQEGIREVVRDNLRAQQGDVRFGKETEDRLHRTDFPIILVLRELHYCGPCTFRTMADAAKAMKIPFGPCPPNR